MKSQINYRKYFPILFLVFVSSIVVSQQLPKSMALINGVAHIGDGKIIEKSVITIKAGKIESVQSTVGLRLNHSAYDTVIDLDGKHVYPALINANNILGLHDAFSVRATRDLSDVGYLNSHIRTLIAFNTDNKITPTIKTNGILYTQVSPRGGMISGNSSIMALEGWNWEDAVLKADDGVHIDFPTLHSGKMDKEKEEKAIEHYNSELSNLNKFFSDALAYFLTPTIEEKNLRFEAMKGVFDGTKNLYVTADNAKDILTALSFIEKHAIKKPVLVSAKEANLVLNEIKKSKVPVMLVRVHDLPSSDDDDIDHVFKLPSVLQKAGILFCLQTAGDSEMEAMNSRNLPFLAGSAAAYGLSKEEALSSVTLNTAKILGVSDLIGSLETGKLASIIVSTGDLLDMKTSHITHAFISGMPVNLNNQQTDLYNKYKIKYGIK